MISAVMVLRTRLLISCEEHCWTAKKKRTTDLLLAYISERRLLILVGCVNVSIAVELLFGAIHHLYSINSDYVKLGLIAAYTIVFGCCVGLATDARRSEVFTACAAYCAVLVVFISGNPSSSNSNSASWDKPAKWDSFQIDPCLCFLETWKGLEGLVCRESLESMCDSRSWRYNTI